MVIPPGVRLAGNKARGYMKARTTQPVRRFNKVEYSLQQVASLLLLHYLKENLGQQQQLYILHPVNILCLYTGARTKDLRVEQLNIPASEQIKHSRVNQLDLTHTALQSTSQYMEHNQPSDTQHNHHLVSDFCLLLPALPLQHAHVPRLLTITPEGSAKHFWNVSQDPHHDDKILKS